MADNIINVKIREAFDTEANWESNDPVLLQGQVAISSDKHGMYKVGDGVNTWTQLLYASHPASDVSQWAKEQTKPSYNISEIIDSVTGVKGGAETDYRIGNVNITKNDIGLANVDNKSSETIRSEITSENVTTALGYTPINKAGDILTGNLLYNMYDHIDAPVKIYGGDSNGYGISVGGGGSTIVGSGLSARGSESLLQATDNELWLTSDNGIHFYTNRTDSNSDAGAVLNINNQFYPNVSSTGSLGTSSYKWGAVFADDYNGKTNGYTWDVSTEDQSGTSVPVFTENSTIKYRVLPTSITVDGQNSGYISLNTNPQTLTLKRRLAFVGPGGILDTEKPWYKVASFTCDGPWQDCDLILLVHNTYQQLQYGILNVHGRCDGNVVYQSCQLQWLAHSNYNNDDFRLYHNVDTNPAVFELWTKFTYSYGTRRFVVLSEGDRVSAENTQWTLYTNTANQGEAEPTSGYTYVSSSGVGIIAKAITLNTARTIDGVSFNGSSNITHYGVCSTAADTAAKTVACTGFTLATGAWIAVRFTVTNTAAVANLTLNVNNTGAKAIKYRNANLPAVGDLSANRTYLFVYDGTYWQWVGDRNTDSASTRVLKTGDTMSGDLLFSDSGTDVRQIQGTVGANDFWRIAGGATASNGGWMEIATADDGNEPIYIRQYTGVYTTIKRTATILDASGNTSLPGTLSAGGNISTPGGVYAGNTSQTAERQVSLTSAAGQIYMYSQGASTGNRGLYAPAHGTGAAISVITVNTNNQPTYSGYLNKEAYQPTTGTSWNIPFCARYNRNEISINDSLIYHFRAGSSQSQTGYAVIQIGNGKDQASANGTRGRIRMFGQGTAYHDIYTNTSANRNIYFPNRGGTIFTTEMFSLSGTTLTISTS